MWDVFLSFDVARLQIPEEIYISENKHQYTHDLEGHAPAGDQTNKPGESEIGNERDATCRTSDDERPEESCDDTSSRVLPRKVRKMNDFVDGRRDEESEKEGDQYLQRELYDRILCPEIPLCEGKIGEVPEHWSNQGGRHEKNNNTLGSREYFGEISEHGIL